MALAGFDWDLAHNFAAARFEGEFAEGFAGELLRVTFYDVGGGVRFVAGPGFVEVRRSGIN